MISMRENRQNHLPKADQLLIWYKKNARSLPWRKTLDPYKIWVSEIMLQQTQVATVIPYWKRWMKQLPTIQAAAEASEDTILKLWEGLGYYSRARNLHKASKIIIRDHKGTFPRQFEQIKRLPGIGPYTCGAIDSIAFDQPSAILDGNVIRVLSRYFGVHGNPKQGKINQQLWKLSSGLVQSAEKCSAVSHHPCSDFNQALMELGALICRKSDPKCGICPWNSHCYAREHRLHNSLPNTGKRPETRKRTYLVFLVEQKGRLLVVKRPRNGINAGLWEFPNIESQSPSRNVTGSAVECLGIKPLSLEKLGVIRHSITKYRISSVYYKVKVDCFIKKTNDSMKWHLRYRLQDLAFTATHRKAYCLYL